MDKYDLNENKEIEFAEKERDMEISKEEDEKLTLDKRMEEADQRDEF